jgi:hypothetical protein
MGVAYGRITNRMARTEADVVTLNERLVKLETLPGEVKALGVSVDHFTEALAASDKLNQAQMKAITDATNSGHALLGQQIGALKELTGSQLSEITENLRSVRSGFDEMRSFSPNNAAHGRTRKPAS